jgi:VWFA-related protein
MRSFAVLLLGALASPAWAQAPAQGQSEIASEEAPITFSSRVNLISVPVVVRDREGRAVGDLKKEDFQVFDKGKLQVISKFSIEKSDRVVEIENAAPGATRQPVPAITSQSASAENYVAYLVDDVHLERGDLLQARQAMHRHLDGSLDPTSRAAIFTTSGVTLADFTADREKLHSAVNRLQPYTSGIDRQMGCPYMSHYVADQLVNQKLYLDGRLFPDQQLYQVIMSGTEPELTAAYEEASNCSGPCVPGQNDQLSGLLMCVVQALIKLREAARLALTYGDRETSLGLGALRDVVRKLSVMPGNRNLVLVSPGFLLTRDTRSDEYDVLERAIHANVVVNTIDMRGLFAIIPGGDVSDQRYVSAIATTFLTQANQAAATQADDVLAELANGTGGTFFHNDNDLKKGLNLLAARPEYVYVLGFSPQDLKLDGAYHALKVSLRSSPNLTTQARRGYWAPNHAVDPAEVAKEEIQETVFSRDEIQEIPVDLQTEFFKTGDFQAELTVSARLNVQNLRFRKANERNNDTLTVVTGLFDANGNYISGIQRLVKMHLRDQTLSTLERGGINLQENFNVAAPGRYLIRLVVRDAEGHATTAKNGGVEIP